MRSARECYKLILEQSREFDLVLQLQFIRTLANPDREPRGDAPNYLANSQEMPEISDLYG